LLKPHIVLNTSFNVKDEPIANTPVQTLVTFFYTSLDGLFVGNFYLKKNKNSLNAY